jgi:hypothetical protein
MTADVTIAVMRDITDVVTFLVTCEVTVVVMFDVT